MYKRQFASTAVKDRTVAAFEDDELPPHTYTWIQILLLFVVAFILGMLIVLVLMQDPNPAAAGTAGTQLVALERVDVPDGTGD